MGVVWRDIASYSRFLHGRVLQLSMVYLLWKYGRGGPVELRVSSWGENRMLRRWMRGLGITHNVLEFDEEEASGGLRSVKTASLRMFVWDVRCGFFCDLCMMLGRLDRCCSS